MSKPSMPKRTPSGLTRCPTCRAHVRAAARPSLTRCPFCDEESSWLSLQRVGRGGALAASLVAFSAVGCGGQETAPEPDPTGQPTEEPPPEPTEEPPPADDPDRYEEVDESVAVDAYGVAPDEGDDGRLESEPEPEASPEPVPMPAYGIAPPIRDED